MATSTVICPEQFTFVSAEWPKWRRRFEQYLLVSGLHSKKDDEKIAALMYFMGGKSDDVFHSLTFTDPAHKKDYDKVLGAYETFFVIRRNIVYDRAVFFQRVQKEGETVDNFVTDLHNLAEYCKFGNLRDELVRDKIVHGIRNKKVSEKLQLDAGLTLEKATLTVRQHETVHKQQEELREEKPSPNIDFVRQKTARARNECQRARVSGPKSSPPVSKPGGSKENPEHKGKTCFWCGSETLHTKEKCPASKTTCHKCDRTGHFARVCKSKKKVREVTIDSHFIGTIGRNRQDDDAPWTATVTVSNVRVNFNLDSGADVTVLPSSLSSHFPQSVQPTTEILRGPARIVLPTTGEMTVKLRHGVLELEEKVYFVQGLTSPLLGRKACKRLELVKLVNTLSTANNSTGAHTKVKPKTEYPKLFEGLGKLEESHTIRLKDGAKPVSVSVPRRVPIPLMGQLKKQLDEMILMDVIIPVDAPTEWCSPMAIAKKPNGTLRICVDLTEVNKSVLRELHLMSAVDYSLGLLGGAKYKSKIDVVNAFWHIPLDEESQLLTTFVTPFGRYCFRRLPYGISSAPEVFQKRMSHLLLGIPGVVCHMDDILIGGKTIEEHDERLRKVLQRLQDAGVTLNCEKCVFGVTKLNFLGHVLDEDGIRPDSEKVKAIVKMTAPNNVPEVRRFLGMANYLGRFLPNMAEIAAPLYALLKAKTEFLWGHQQQGSFDKIKQIVSSEPVLVIYDVNKPTRVSADSSSYGLGSVLLQKQDDGSLRPVAFASRTLSVAEKRYAQIEKEALAFTWACERFNDFVSGLQFEIETDHKPLVPIFTSKHLDDLTPRLQRFRMRMMRYSFSIFYTPGKNLAVADALSRCPLSDTGSRELEEETAAYVNTVIASLPVSDEKLKLIWQRQQEDTVLQKIAQYSATGWPEKKKSLDPACQEFWSVRHDIAVEDGLLLRGQRLIIPVNMQPEIMERLHQGHQGITKCRARARSSVWWPGLSKQIETQIKQCLICIQDEHPRHEPLQPSEFPARPWQKVAMDLFHSEGKCYLLIVDYYSRFPEIALLERQTAECVILHCKSVFARHGIPETVVSDNGPQFQTLCGSAFATFARIYGFSHTTSSPRFPQSNGFAEAGVKTVKACLKKNTDPYLGLLEYRATPLANGYSPAELLMSRKIRSTLPLLPALLNPKTVSEDDLRNKEERRRDAQKRNHDRRHGVHQRADPEEGEVVWIQDMRTWGTIKRKSSHPRSFIVETPRGEVRRNRLHLSRARTKELPAEAMDDDDVEIPDLPEVEEQVEQQQRRGRRRQAAPQQNPDNPPPPAPARPRRVTVPIQRLNYGRLGQPGP